MNVDLAKAAPTSASLVASFLFVDLVAFSKKSTADQFAQKRVLTEIIQSGMAVIATRDYMIKDTGDGAWMGFVANPEHALYVALAISAACRPHTRDSALAREDLRIGVNLGAVKQTLDFESRPNFIGDGINVAKRVMDFARPGEITASRSYYDAVASLDASYPDLFSQREAGSDKHGRAHELYSIEPDVRVLEKLRAELAPRSLATPASTGISAAPASVPRTATRWLVTLSVLAAVAAAGVAGLWFVTGARSPATSNATGHPEAKTTQAAPPPAPTASKTGKESDAPTEAPSVKPVAEATPKAMVADEPPTQASPKPMAADLPAASKPPVQATRARTAVDPDFTGESDEPLGPITAIPPGAPATISKSAGRATMPPGARGPGVQFAPEGGLPLPANPSLRSQGADLLKDIPGQARQGPVISIQ